MSRGSNKDLSPLLDSSPGSPFPELPMSSPGPRAPRSVQIRRHGQKPSKGGPSSVLHLWGWEIASCVLSIATLAVIVVVLRIYDGGRLPELPPQLSLNTILAFLASFSKAALMMPVAEAIGQHKWAWFEGEGHRLSDFETLDRASRGVWGSFGLLAGNRWRHLVCLGAVVSILSLVTSPITQQMITYPVREVGLGQTGYTQAVWDLDIPIGFGDIVTDMRPNSSTYELGFTSFPSASMPVAAVCRSGDCAFPRFQTLGICSKTADITGSLNVSFVAPSAAFDNSAVWIDKTYPNVTGFNVSLPIHGVWFMSPGSHTLMTVPLNRSMAFAEDSDLSSAGIFNIAVFWHRNTSAPYPPDANTPLPKYQAVEIMFHFCVMELEVKVEEGSALTTVLGASHAVAHPSKLPGTEYWCSPDVNGTGKNQEFGNRSVVNMRWSTQGSGCRTFEADKSGWTALRGPERSAPGVLGSEGLIYNITDSSRQWFTLKFWKFLQPIIVGIPSGASLVRNTSPMVAGQRILMAIMGGPDDESDDNPHASIEPLREAAEAIAMGATNIVRTWPNIEGEKTASFQINGTAFGRETYVHITWPWLTLLAVQILMGTTFFAVTIFVTSGTDEARILKNSALAGLSAFSAESRAAVGRLDATAAMERRAKAFDARFMDGELAVAARGSRMPGRRVEEDTDSCWDGNSIGLSSLEPTRTNKKVGVGMAF